MFTRSLAWLFLAGVLGACSQEGDSGREGPVVTEPGNAEVVELPAIEAEPKGPSAHSPAGKTPTANATDPARERAQPGRLNTSDLIEELLSFDWDGDAQDGQRIDGLLRQLQMQGADALVAIRDFLLDGEAGADAPPALRQALLEVLLGLGVPQVVEIAQELLAGGLPPAELWQVGHYLESVQPGGYTDMILQAAERVLIEAGPETYFPAEFFQFVGRAGDQDTALVLAETQSERGAYATLALAALPDGIGLASLERDARLFESGQDTLQGRLAIQLLAQHAPYYSAAATALMELAERGGIPNDVWPYLLDLLAGNWVLTMDPPTSGLVGSHTYYRPGGNQVIYRVAPLPGTEVERQSERLFLLDRLQQWVPSGLGINPGG